MMPGGVEEAGASILSSFLLRPLTQRLSEDSMIVFLLMSSDLKGTMPVETRSKKTPVTQLTTALLNYVADVASSEVFDTLEEIDGTESSFIDTAKKLKTHNRSSSDHSATSDSSMNFMDLVLALQKHLLSSAGRDPIVYRLENIATSKKGLFEYLVKTEKLDGGESTAKGQSRRKRNRPGKIANIEDISNDGGSAVEAGGMRLLMDYTSLLIDRVVEILTQVIAW